MSPHSTACEYNRYRSKKIEKKTNFIFTNILFYITQILEKNKIFSFFFLNLKVAWLGVRDFIK